MKIFLQGKMRLKSLRDQIAYLKEFGEIQEIDEQVTLDLEIGAIIRRSYDLQAPAPLFNNIKGISPGFRVLGAPAGLSHRKDIALIRVASALGLPPTSTALQIIDALSQAYQKTPISPQLTDTAPCKERIILGEEIDLFKLPAPLLHGGDGGRYLNTWGTVIVHTPDRKWTNWSIARVMLHGKQTMVGLIVPLQHLGQIHAQWKEIDQPMPFALALGCDPVIPFISGMAIPGYTNEADFIGGFLGEPLDVVRCETVDITVPASSEIIIEGFVSPQETAPEGPMGEYAGYLKGESRPQPIYHVTAITHRHNPILPVVVAGTPVEECHTNWGLVVSATILADLRKHDLPVTAAFCPFESALHWLVITLNSSYREKHTHSDLIQQIGNIVFFSKSGAIIPKILLMEDDIDPCNSAEVIWAFATRCHPAHGHFLFKDSITPPILAYLSDEEQKICHSTKVIYNCLSPANSPSTYRQQSANFENGWPEEVKTNVLKKWNLYGYKNIKDTN